MRSLFPERTAAVLEGREINLSFRKRPTLVPARPNFSSGPCSKRPGWSLESLSGAALGRSHRAKVNKIKLKAVIDRTRVVLEIPDNYRIGIVPASDTGAVELAIWSLLGARGVDMLAWESFGRGWVSDVIEQLKINNNNTQNKYKKKRKKRTRK